MTTTNKKSVRFYIDQYFINANVAMKYIVINLTVFLLIGLFGFGTGLAGKATIVQDWVSKYLALSGNLGSFILKPYTLLSYSFIHFGLLHVLFNLLWLYWMGNLFLDFLNKKQFHWVYLGGVGMGALFFLLIQLLPFQQALNNSILIGASAGVMAIFAATTTLIPDYRIRLLLFGDVKLKYLLLVYIVLDLIGTTSGSSNFGGNLAHLGGVFWGFTFVKLLQKGTDLSKYFNKKTKLKVVKNTSTHTKTKAPNINQAEIDAILDKISKTGYENLSSREKQILFDASQHKK